MTTPLLRLEALDTATAPEAALRAIARHTEALRAERLPEDPPLNLTALLSGLRRPDVEAETRHFLLWDAETVAASAAVRTPRDQNTHLAFLDLSVLAPYRRRGLATRLLAEVVLYARQNNRRLLTTNVGSRLPSGEAVLRHLGAERVQEQQFIQLILSEMEPGLLTRWISEAAAGAADYRLWQVQGAYPEDRLADIADLHDVMHTAPSGTRDIQHWQTTPQVLREREASLTATGQQRLTTFAQHQGSGQLAAFTELFWDPQRLFLLSQRATAVRPEHRRHSLGRWIKAANLHAAQSANPEAQIVRAGNTPDNTGMLAINHALGFRTYLIHTDWQIETAALAAHLGKSHG
jgi:mycothiol synthase